MTKCGRGLASPATLCRYVAESIRQGARETFLRFAASIDLGHRRARKFPAHLRRELAANVLQSFSPEDASLGDEGFSGRGYAAD